MFFTATTTRQGETKQLKGGKSVAEFLVVEEGERYKKGGEWTNRKTFYVLSYWKRPNLGSSVAKGSVLEVQGELTPEIFTGKDGTQKVSLNIHATAIRVVKWGKKQTIELQPAAELNEPIDDLPF